MKNSPDNHKKTLKNIKTKSLVYALLSFVFPFIYYFRYIWPSSSLLLISNDFVPLYANYKTYFAELLSRGNFPLWSPAEVCGYSFFSNPFTAPLYPLNIIPVTISKVIGNYNPGFHQVFTILGVAIFSLGLYLWLKDSFGEEEPAFFSAAIISASWSISGFLRFPNAIHTIAWLPWVLFVMRRLSLFHMKRSFWIGAGALLVLFQVTAGYPYFLIYSYFLYFGYFLFLYFESEGWKKFKKGFINIACMLTAPLFLSAPYVISIKELMKATVDRSGGSFEYSTIHAFGPFETLASFLYPPATSVEGCVYFGIIAAFFASLYFLKGKKIRQKLILIVGVLLILSVAYGYRSYIFALLWNFLPVFDSMRVFPRITVILLPIMALAIYQGYLIFFENAGRSEIKNTIWLPALALVLISGLLYFTAPAIGSKHVAEWLSFSADKKDFLMYGILTLMLIAILARIDFSSLKRGRTVFLLIVLLAATADTGNQGRFLWSYPVKNIFNKYPEVKTSGNDMLDLFKEVKKVSFSANLIDNYFKLKRIDDFPGLTPRGLTFTPMANYYYKSYIAFLAKVEDETAENKKRVMAAVKGKKKIFFHIRENYDKPSEFIADAQASEAFSGPPVIKYFNGNKLVFEVDTLKPGYITWLDNYDPGWKLKVDGKSAGIKKTFDTFKTAQLDKPGKHRVEFSYFPFIPYWAFFVFAFGIVFFIAALVLL